jgi:hypothetical protein
MLAAPIGLRLGCENKETAGDLNPQETNR